MMFVLRGLIAIAGSGWFRLALSVSLTPTTSSTVALTSAGAGGAAASRRTVAATRLARYLRMSFPLRRTDSVDPKGPTTDAVAQGRQCARLTDRQATRASRRLPADLNLSLMASTSSFTPGSTVPRHHRPCSGHRAELGFPLVITT